MGPDPHWVPSNRVVRHSLHDPEMCTYSYKIIAELSHSELSYLLVRATVKCPRRCTAPLPVDLGGCSVDNLTDDAHIHNTVYFTVSETFCQLLGLLFLLFFNYMYYIFLPWSNIYIHASHGCTPSLYIYVADYISMHRRTRRGGGGGVGALQPPYNFSNCHFLAKRK